MTAGAVRTPVWRLTYKGHDVTREVAAQVLTITYTDNADGEPDEVDVLLADADGRWRGSWFPADGDRMELRLGYRGEPLLPCGSFDVDKVEASGPVRTFNLHGIAAGPLPALRTKRSHAYDHQTLRQIVTAVAGRHGLRVVGEIGETKVERVTQNRETDLRFLERLGERFGYVSGVRGELLVFSRAAALDAAPPVWTVREGDTTEYKLTSNTHGTYRACVATYEDARSGRTIKREVRADGVRKGDVYRLHTRAESPAQAEAQAAAKLRQLNARGREGELTLPGDPRLVAGTNGTLEGFGELSGKYQVRRSVHRVGKLGGYTTNIEVRGL
jgi:phage protein D